MKILKIIKWFKAKKYYRNMLWLEDAVKRIDKIQISVKNMTNKKLHQ